MKKTFITALVIFFSSIAFSQKDSIWIAKYQSENGVTRFIGTTTLKNQVNPITDSELKVVGNVDASGNLILTTPKKTLMAGRYAVYNSMGQLLYLVKID